MAEFKAGDRVRGRATPTTLLYAGRAGEVRWVSRGPDGAAVGYHVLLDGDQTPVSDVIFSPDELEPEAGGGP
jgi:hypothetical protein